MSTDFGSGSSIWPSYYAAFQGRSPRRLFAAALERFGNSPEVGRRAIDLGSGDGTETEALLREGWVVLAVDAQPDAKARLDERIPAELRQNLRVEVRPFEQIVSLPRADFIYSGASLPFCRPDAFGRLWSVITSSVVQEGRIACDLFGERDTWADRSDMTFFTRAETERLFHGFAIEQFDEMDQDGEAFSGPKHWHVFSVIARRPR